MDHRRVLKQCLHPDKQPDERRAAFTEAIQALNAAVTIFEKSDYQKWRPKE
jgi:hypothetical protein